MDIQTFIEKKDEISEQILELSKNTGVLIKLNESINIMVEEGKRDNELETRFLNMIETNLENITMLENTVKKLVNKIRAVSMSQYLYQSKEYRELRYILDAVHGQENELILATDAIKNVKETSTIIDSE